MRRRAIFKPRVTALTVAAAVFVVGAALVWVGVLPGLSSIDVCTDFGGLPEGSSGSSKPDPFPPGTIVCEYETPRGEVTTSQYVPWFEWAVLGVAAVLVGLLTAGVLRGQRR